MEPFAYERPHTQQAILDRLAAGPDGVKVLAGGTDLLTQVRSRLLRPSLILDLKGVEELHRLEQNTEGLSIGAAVILNRLLEDFDLQPGYQALREAISDLASCTIRNRATLVGNVTNASPCADTVPPLCVMDAQVEILGPSGVRTMSIPQFITGVREVQLNRGEFVTRVIVPRLPNRCWSGFLKQKRVKGHDLALANAALLWDPERRRLRLSVGSCHPVPVLIHFDEMVEQPNLDRMIERAQAAIHPIDDVRASREYRREMVSVLVRRLFVRMTEERKSTHGA